MMQPFNNHIILKGGIIVISKRKLIVISGVITIMIALLTACGGTGGGLQPPEEEITFECPVLEQAVRDAKGYTGEPTGPIYASDVLGITILNFPGCTSRETDAHNLLT